MLEEYDDHLLLVYFIRYYPKKSITYKEEKRYRIRKIGLEKRKKKKGYRLRKRGD
jgi:hypothetical protein